MEIAIVGAGLVGRITAWRLNALNQGLKITLIDEKDRHFFGTGLVAAAMVAPCTEAVSTEAITQKLGEASFHLWKKWLPELEEQTGFTIEFNQQGTLVVAHPQDEPDWQRYKVKANYILSEKDMQSFAQKELSIAEPQLAETFSKALYFPDEGCIDNLTLYAALNAYFDEQSSIKFIENTAISMLSNDGYLSEVQQQFDHVVDCRGNGAKADLSRFRSVRGEVIRVFAPEISFSHSVRLIHPRFPLYIAPRSNHEYIIGATQIETDDDSPMTIRSGLELLSALYSLHKGFAEAKIIDLLVGMRPTFMDNLPKIETDERLTRINGLYRHGYLFTPIIVDQFIKELL